jgi:LSD1 subclass zinc finger protein
MTLEPLTCSHCGAPIEVPSSAKFVKCAHCGTRLVVKRTPTASYTEVLDQIGERTERMAEDLEAIRLQNELERIDREWQLQREQFMVRSKDGSTSVPSETGSAIGSIIAVVFGVFWLFMAVSIFKAADSILPFFGPLDVPFGCVGPFFVLFGVVFIVAALAGGFSSAAKARQYRDAEQAYQSQREEILRRLEERREA